MKGQIKEITKLEDFKRVYKVFLGPPYNEKYTEELEEIYREYKEKGFIYGAYNGSDCIGMIALECGTKSDQPVNFNNKKVMYLADIAVLNDYRRKGLGNQLMLYGVMQSKIMGYEKMYMRTLKNGSMSQGIALKIGFRQIPDVFQDVEKERISGQTETMQNIFLEIDLNSLDKNKLMQGIKSVNLDRDNEREID